MQIIRQGGLAPEGPGTALALGYFDGVHIGHVQVVEAAAEYAALHGLRLAVFTFLRGGPKEEKKLVMSESQKQRALEALGVELCFEPDFESFSALSPREFFSERMVKQYRAQAVFCGENYGFGARREGNTAVLAGLCKEQGLHLSVLPLAVWKGAPVSSSRIRGTLAMGDMEDVQAMLGRPYEISFPVQHGQGLGRSFGFPTINQVFPEEMQPPAFGVYITSTLLDGVWHPSATGYGNRPTVNGESPTCETFIPGVSGDLYGRELCVRFYKRLAGLQRFASPKELAEAVRGWAGQAQAYFAAGEEKPL